MPVVRSFRTGKRNTSEHAPLPGSTLVFSTSKIMSSEKALTTSIRATHTTIHAIVVLVLPGSQWIDLLDRPISCINYLPIYALGARNKKFANQNGVWIMFAAGEVKLPMCLVLNFREFQPIKISTNVVAQDKSLDVYATTKSTLLHRSLSVIDFSTDSL